MDRRCHADRMRFSLLADRGYFRAILVDRLDRGLDAVLGGGVEALTDLNMPGMSGIELCERIVANRPDVPVVVITAFGSLETAVAALRAGAYDFITKPIDIDELIKKLNEAVKSIV